MLFKFTLMCPQYIISIALLPSKHKKLCHNVLETLDNWLYRSCQIVRMKVLLMSVGNVVAALRSDVVATLWQLRINVVTKFQNRNFRKYLTTSFQRCIHFTSANILGYSLDSYLYGYNRHLDIQTLLKVEF